MSWQVLPSLKSTGCLLLAPDWPKCCHSMAIWQEDLGRELERLNCPIYLRPIQYLLTALAEMTIHYTRRETMLTVTTGLIPLMSLSRASPNTFQHLWKLSRVLCLVYLSSKPSVLTPFLFLVAVPLNQFFASSVIMWKSLLEDAKGLTQGHVAKHICEGLSLQWAWLEGVGLPCSILLWPPSN